VNESGKRLSQKRFVNKQWRPERGLSHLIWVAERASTARSGWRANDGTAEALSACRTCRTVCRRAGRLNATAIGAAPCAHRRRQCVFRRSVFVGCTVDVRLENVLRGQ
jgi:hypothetical protein